MTDAASSRAVEPDALFPELTAGSRLERVLRSGRFAVTAELNPPDSANPQDVYDAALVLSEVCDAINATDASGAHCHMSSVAICALLTRAGYEPVYQISCRDRNRIAIQGDLLGAAAMGVKNVLCLTGDDVTAGDQPQAKRVFDLDSIQLLFTAKIMRDHAMFLSGRKLTTPPRVFLGAAENPFVQPFDWRPLRLAKKVEAGAQFIQTQYCFDVPRFQRFMARVRDLGLDQRVYILVGVGPLRSDKAAEYMRNKVPGVHIPDPIVERLRQAPKEKKLAVGKRICVEIIQQVKEIPGVAGVHVMAYRQEELVAEIIEEAGLLPRPLQPSPGARAAYARARRRAQDHSSTDPSQPRNPWRIDP
jgi:methylenetetrahydrofolate reductase (NADPH)